METFLATKDDGLGDAMKVMREEMAKHHVEMINKMLLTDNDTLAGDNIESLDRIIGSYSEINGVGQTAGDLDIYGLDRDAGATWSDAYVNHNSNVARTFTIDLLDTTLTNLRKNGAQPKVILTGYDTQERIQQA